MDAQFPSRIAFPAKVGLGLLRPLRFCVPLVFHRQAARKQLEKAEKEAARQSKVAKPKAAGARLPDTKGPPRAAGVRWPCLGWPELFVLWTPHFAVSV